MIERTFNNGSYFYNFNNQGVLTLHTLVRTKAKEFTDEDALLCASFIEDEIAVYKTYYMQMITFSIFDTLMYETCVITSQETYNKIRDIRRASADKIADYIAFTLSR